MIPRTDLSGITVMVVDDDGDNADLFTIFLESCGARVIEATSGVDALRLLDDMPTIDVLITDLSMPDISGLQLVRSVRAHTVHGSLPAIAVSGYPENYFAADAHAFTTFMLKPVDVDALAAEVKRLVVASPRQRGA